MRADLSQQAGELQVENEVVGEAVGCDRDVHAARQEFPERAGDAFLGLAVGAVRDVRAAAGERIEIGIVHVGHVGRQHVGTEEADLVEVLHRAHAVTRLDGAAFGDMLREMQMRVNVLLGAQSLGLAQDVLGHRVRTVRRQMHLQASAERTVVALMQPHRRRELRPDVLRFRRDDPAILDEADRREVSRIG